MYQHQRHQQPRCTEHRRDTPHEALYSAAAAAGHRLEHGKQRDSPSGRRAQGRRARCLAPGRTSRRTNLALDRSAQCASDTQAPHPAPQACSTRRCRAARLGARQSLSHSSSGRTASVSAAELQPTAVSVHRAECLRPAQDDRACGGGVRISSRHGGRGWSIRRRPTRTHLTGRKTTLPCLTAPRFNMPTAPPHLCTSFLPPRPTPHQVAAGAQSVVTLPVFGVSDFATFVSDCRTCGITCAVTPGILPVREESEMRRVCRALHLTPPPWLERQLRQLKGSESVSRYGTELFCRQDE